MNRNRSFALWRCLLPACPAILLTAVYLTFLVDLQTLETAMQRVFIFCYFVVMGVLACFLKGKYAEGKPFPLQSRIAAALLAALLVGAGWNTFLPHVRFPLEGSHMYALWEKLLYTLGAWCVVFYFAQLALLFLARPMEKRGWTERQKVLAFLLMGNFVFLFFTSDRIQPTHLTQGFLLLLTVASVWCFNRKSGCMEKYRAKGSRAAIGIIAVYASLASFAQRFFLDGNTRMHFSLPGLFYVLSGILWFIPVVWLMLFALEWLSARPRTLPKPGSRRRAWWTLFAVLAVCQLGVLWILWPGGFPADAIDQLSQATGLYGINDWHPVMHTLLEKLILTVIPQAGAITAVQMLLFTWLLTAILMIGYDSGIPLRRLTFLGAVIELLPNQALSASNVLKDFPFTLALLWGLYLLALLAMKKPQSRKFGFYVCLTADIFLICTLRHNGVVPGLAVAVLCIVLTLKNHAALKWRPAVSALTAVVLLAVYKGPVFTALGVVPNGMSPYTTMMCAAGSCINKELPLSEESEQILEKALPLEDWGEYYSRFVGHDPYYWGRPAGSEPYKISDITARDAFTVYLEALRKYPDVVIKDRLDGTDILWDVVQPPDSFNAKSFNFVYTFSENTLPLDTSRLDRLDDGSYIKTAVPAKAYYSAANTPINSAADMLLWRTGAYLIAFWVLLLFWSKNRMGRLWWAALPMLANAAGSMLVLYHQSFRYVYFVQVSVLALLYITAAVKPHWNDEPQSHPANEIPDITPEKEDEHG